MDTIKYFIFKAGQWVLPDGETDATGYTIPDTISDEEHEYYDGIADGLAKKLAVSKVHVVVQFVRVTNERKVCYISEPNYATKIRIMDQAINLGVFMAADQLREACTIKESSDAITYSDSPESDDYKLGITDYCTGMVSRLRNQFKKK